MEQAKLIELMIQISSLQAKILDALIDETRNTETLERRLEALQNKLDELQQS